MSNGSHLAALASGETEFIETKEYRRFAEFCDACRRYRYIGLCYGPPGVGKTLSARHYARWGLIGPCVEDVPSGAVTSVAADGHTVVYTPPVETSPRRLAAAITDLVAGLEYAARLAAQQEVRWSPRLAESTRTELVIIDEADRLRPLSLEQVRDLYDRRGFGVVLIGMPGLEKRLARYPQLYSRVGFVHPFRPLSAEEVTFILTRHWQRLGLVLSVEDFTDAEALAAVVRITGGNFRLLHRLLTQVERILAINELRTVTKEVVDAAREGLVIGPL